MATRLGGRKVSLGVVVYVVVGLVVAADHGFLDDVWDLERLLSAILAVAAWPLVLLDVHVAI